MTRARSICGARAGHGRRLNGAGVFTECLLSLEINFAQGHAKLPGDTGTVFVFRREVRWLTVSPAELSLDRPPGCLHGARSALQLVTTHRIPAYAKSPGLAKKHVFYCGNRIDRRQHAEH